MRTCTLPSRSEKSWELRHDSTRIAAKWKVLGVGTRYFAGASDLMAEREGFEPPVGFPLRRFSRPEPSTTRPPLRYYVFTTESPQLVDFLKRQTVFKTACFNRSHIPPREVGSPIVRPITVFAVVAHINGAWRSLRATPSRNFPYGLHTSSTKIIVSCRISTTPGD